MNIRLKYIFLSLLTAGIHAEAARQDSAVAERQNIWQQVKQEAWQNPALMGTAYRFSQTQVSIGSDYRKQTEAFQLEKGTGFFLPEVKVTSYLRLSDKTTVWGEAAYMNGKMRDISYNSTSDFDLLAPYVLGDSVGGDTQRERYLFAGGYATRLGKWMVGGLVKFRAEQEYRTHDPRMRGVTSDLTISAGAAYGWDRYQLGLSAVGNIYRQTNDVDFYQEAGGIAEYQMTGLGTYIPRFTGTDTNVFFDGGGTALAIDLQPRCRQGWQGNITLTEHRYERISDDYNSLTLTTLYREQAATTFGWRSEGAHDWAVLGHYEWGRTSGDEHVAGQAVMQSFPTLASLTMYKNDKMHSWLAAQYGQNGMYLWHAQAKAGYQTDRAKYVFPERRQQVGRAYGELQGQMQWAPCEQWLLNVMMTARYDTHTTAKISMPYADMEPHFVQMVNHNYRFLKADYTSAYAKLRADYRLAKGGVNTLFAELGAGVVFSSEKATQTDLHLTIGVGM